MRGPAKIGHPLPRARAIVKKILAFFDKAARLTRHVAMAPPWLRRKRHMSAQVGAREKRENLPPHQGCPKPCAEVCALSFNGTAAAMPQPLIAHPSQALTGVVRPPGDKSISHRALILGALAQRETTISGLLESADVLATAKALEALDIPIVRDGTQWRILGRGVGGLWAGKSKKITLDFGNSGTAVRLMMGVLAGHPFSVRLTGDASLSRRPMGRVLTPLRDMGLAVLADDAGDETDRLPLTIQGNPDLVPITYVLPVASAQVKSAILLAGLHAPGETTVIEPHPTRDHTENMLRHFGASLRVWDHPQGRAVTVRGEAELQGQELTVPADPSSAAFLAAAALICPGSDIRLTGVLINSTRIGFYDTLKEMGARISFENLRQSGGEPVADIWVRSSALRAVTVPESRVPSMVDEYPILAALAAYAEGETVMHGLGELRVKESDRLSAMADGLAQVGVPARIAGDSLQVTGVGRPRGGGPVATHMDHRIAMAFLILGLGAEHPVTVDDGTMIATSFPGFTSLMTELGAKISKA